MATRHPSDLSQIRPNAELDHGAATGRGTPARGGGRHGRRRRPAKWKPRPPRRGWSWPARIAVGFASLVVIAAIGIGAIVVIVSPAELVRREMVRQVKSYTGRDLAIRGGAQIVFYPNIGVALNDIELSAPPGMRAPPTLKAGRVEVAVALLPLLSRKVHVDRVALIRPVFDLRVAQDGRQSWQFAGAELTDGRVPIRLAHLGGAGGVMRDVDAGGGVLQTAVPAQAAAGLLDKLELRSITLEKAALRYEDEQTGAVHRLDDLDLELQGRRIKDPMQAEGAVVWRNEKLRFTARVDTLRQVLDGQAAKVRVTLDGRPVSAGFDGLVKLDDNLNVTGQTRLDGDSLAGTARWLGTLLPNAAPLGGFNLSGRLVAEDKSVSLNGASLKLGAARATGAVLVAMRSKRPYISADLKISELDLDRLGAAFEGAKVGNLSASRSVRAKPAGRGPEAPASIEDLLRRSQTDPKPRSGAGRFAPQVRGYTGRNEWNTDPIDASGLQAVDAKARLRIERLKVANLRIARTVTRIALTDARARIDIDDLDFYGGTGKGVITAQPRTGAGLAFGANLRGSGITARPLLKDAAEFERIDGRGDLELVVSGAGSNQHAIANSLNGTAKFAFKDGAVVGWNLAQMIRGLQQGRFSGLEGTPTEKTDFSELSASFKIQNGVANTSDLRMVSPLVRVGGKGIIGIGARNLDLGLTTRLVASLRGQGAGTGGAGIDIPIKLTGPWDDPRIMPDVAGLASDPGKLVERAKELGRNLKGRDLGEMVRGVLGGDDGKGGSEAGDVLKQLWKR